MARCRGECITQDVLACSEAECIDGEIAGQGDYSFLVQPEEADSLGRKYPGLKAKP